ncbi:uncharacterized protein METZ01_LOCUS51028 [marine metagenome]|uniref:Terpene utilization protein AtuA n=1 Tax=marine metagenome TaxID=408172 RepID=A0A381S418_9ZZZZ
MKKNKTVKIGCASAFWGDTSSAAPQLVHSGSIDYLVFDYLAEVTMSILAGAKMKNPDLGYATDFIKHIGPLLTDIKKQGIKVISNAGGINLKSCRNAVLEEAKRAGIELNIAIVEGDNLINQENALRELPVKELETGKAMPKGIVSINAYLGAAGVRQALELGADMVITGRCVDSAVVLGPLMYEFDWKYNEYDKLAAGSLAGHIIECGAQCTGGNFTDWHLVNNFDNMGFPIVEVESDGSFIVTKPEGTGGIVSFGSVAEQFLYEIGNPGSYLLPDVTCDFTNVHIEEVDHEKVLVKGAKGFAPTNTYKVSATYLHGYRITIAVIICGINAPKKAQVSADAIIKKTKRIFSENGLGDYLDTNISIIGTETTYGKNGAKTEPREVLLRIIARHKQKDALILLSRELAQASTGMTPGFINMLGGRPSVSPSIRLFSFLIPKVQIITTVDIHDKQYEVETYTAKSNHMDTNTKISGLSDNIDTTDAEVALINLAYARSGDKGDHANIGVIARKAEYLPYIRKALSIEIVAKYFAHVLKGEVERWDVPGINGLNFLLKNSLGGGGMASLNVDPQGKAYAQQLLDIMIPVPHIIAEETKKNHD